MVSIQSLSPDADVYQGDQRMYVCNCSKDNDRQYISRLVILVSCFGISFATRRGLCVIKEGSVVNSLIPALVDAHTRLLCDARTIRTYDDGGTANALAIHPVYKVDRRSTTVHDSVFECVTRR